MKKMLKTTLALVLSLMLLLSFAACDDAKSDKGNPTNNSQNSNNNNPSGNTTPDTGASYTKGAISGDKYINKWADLRFDLDDIWTNGSADQYASFEDDNTECGLFVSNEDGSKQLTIVFEKLTKNVTEEEYINIIATGLKTQYESIFGECDLTNYEATVAGRTYKSAKVAIEGALTQTVHVRIVDGYAIAVLATATNDFDAASIVASIQAAN